MTELRFLLIIAEKFLKGLYQLVEENNFFNSWILYLLLGVVYIWHLFGLDGSALC